MLVMTCNMEAQPKPNIRWFNGATEIKDGGRYSITCTESGPDQYVVKLQIKVSKAFYQ